MKILVLAALVPYPPHDGDKLRLFHFLDQFRRQGHQVDLFCLTRVKKDFRQAQALRPWVRKLHLESLSDFELALNLAGGTFVGQSWNVAAFHSPKFREALAAHATTREGAGTGAVMAHRLRMAPYADHFLRERAKAHPGEARPAYFLDLTDSLSGYSRQASACPGFPRLKKWAAHWDAYALEAEERDGARKADQTWVVAESEMGEIVALGADPSRVRVIPNGVERSKGPGRFSRPDLAPPGAPLVVFAGNLGYAPNEDAVRHFARNLWPTIHQAVPEAVFAAVGGWPRSGLRALDNGMDLRIRGYVPILEPYLRHATLSVAPLRVAAGFQNKVALSLAAGVPVVATPLALRGLPKGNWGGVLAREADGSFSEAVIGLLKRPARVQALARKTGTVWVRRFGWDQVGRQIQVALRQAAAAQKVVRR